MKRCLAVATLALGLIAFGCDDDGDDGGTGGRGGTGGATGGRGGTGGATGGTGGATGGTGGATGGTGGATGGTGGATGGTGGATGGTGGSVDAADMAATEGGAETGAEAGGETAAGICAAYTAGSGMLANIAASDFCQEYATTCMFGAAMRYTNMGDCMTRYMAAATAIKTCRAGHLCNAKALGGAHCDHATGYGAVAACNPY